MLCETLVTPTCCQNGVFSCHKNQPSLVTGAKPQLRAECDGFICGLPKSLPAQSGIRRTLSPPLCRRSQTTAEMQMFSRPARNRQNSRAARATAALRWRTDYEQGSAICVQRECFCVLLK